MDLEVIFIVNSRIVPVLRIEVIIKYKTVHFQNKKQLIELLVHISVLIIIHVY